jgi:hypothetical protein
VFENFRGLEYGWDDDLTSARAQSDKFYILEGLMRADLPANWKREALKCFKGQVSFGSPADLGWDAMGKWVTFASRGRKAIPRIYPTGAHSTGTKLNQKKEDYATGKDFLWKPKSDYRTYVVNVIEHRVRPVDLGKLIKMVKDETGGVEEFDAASPETKEKIVKEIEARRKHKGPFTVTQFGWWPKSRHPEQIEAHEYMAACERYQASKAGRRAKRLLLENLSDVQRKDYFKRGYFFVMPRGQDCPLHERRLYVIERSFPNGNVLRVRKKQNNLKRWEWFPEQTYCFHTKEPYATDDILLSQKLVLENDEFEFLKQANITTPMHGGIVPLALIKRSV